MSGALSSPAPAAPCRSTARPCRSIASVALWVGDAIDLAGVTFANGGSVGAEHDVERQQPARHGMRAPATTCTWIRRRTTPASRSACSRTRAAAPWSRSRAQRPSRPRPAWSICRISASTRAARPPVFDVAELAPYAGSFGEIVLNLRWSDLEPAPGTLDTSFITSAIAQVEAFNSAHGTDSRHQAACLRRLCGAGLGQEHRRHAVHGLREPR